MLNCYVCQLTMIVYDPRLNTTFKPGKIYLCNVIYDVFLTYPYFKSN